MTEESNSAWGNLSMMKWKLGTFYFNVFTLLFSLTVQNNADNETYLAVRQEDILQLGVERLIPKPKKKQ